MNQIAGTPWTTGYGLARCPRPPRPFGAVPVDERARSSFASGLRPRARRRARPRERPPARSRRRRASTPRSSTRRDGDDYLFVLDGERRSPTRAPALSRPGSGGRRASSTRRRFEIAAGPAAAARGARALRAARRHVHARRARSTPSSRTCRGCADLGVTAIELMPVATFPGERGWGYDGVYAFAPHPRLRWPARGSHGSSMRPIARGSASCSTSSTTTSARAPRRSARSARTSPTATTPSGATRSTTPQRGVREWAIQNAIMWTRDYRIDGLRLDAVHAIYDDSRPCTSCASCASASTGS